MRASCSSCSRSKGLSIIDMYLDHLEESIKLWTNFGLWNERCVIASILVLYQLGHKSASRFGYAFCLG